MANTNILYNAAFSGSMSAISSRWLTTVSASIYSQVVQACVAFATALDANLGVVSPVSQSDADLLQTICGAFWSNRLQTNTPPANRNYSDDVIPLADLWRASRGQLQPVPGGGSDSLVNQSAVPGTTISDALDNLSNNDPPALILSIYGTNRIVAWAASQILASSVEAPRYVWEPPAEVNSFSIGPDNALYNYSMSAGGIVRYYMPQIANGTIRRTLVVPNNGQNLGHFPIFFATAPKSGVDAWTCINSSNGVTRRFPASAFIGKTYPEDTWVSWDTITGGVSAGGGLCLDESGNLWLADGNTGIMRMTAASAAGPSGVGTFDVTLQGSNWNPAGQERVDSAVDRDGGFWTAYYAFGAGGLRTLNAAGIAGVVGAGPSNPAPTAIITVDGVAGCEGFCFDYAGNLWVASYDSPLVARVPAAQLGTSGAKTPDIVLTGGGQIGDGNATGPYQPRMMLGFGPLR